MNLMICTTVSGGCGFIGLSDEFPSLRQNDVGIFEEDDFVPCANCGQDHVSALTTENMNDLVNDSNRELAEKLLRNDQSLVAIARCGCVHHAEEGRICQHDVTEARKRLWKPPSTEPDQITEEDFKAPQCKYRMMREEMTDGQVSVVADYSNIHLALISLEALRSKIEKDIFTLYDDLGRNIEPSGGGDYTVTPLADTPPQELWDRDTLQKMRRSAFKQ